MTPLEQAREVVAGWHDRLIGDIALIIAEAEARGRAALAHVVRRQFEMLETISVASSHWDDNARITLDVVKDGVLSELERALADPSPAVREANEQD